MFRSAYALFLFSLSAPLAAQQVGNDAAPAATTKIRRPLTEADYGKIETLGASELSPDGKWVAYDFRQTSGGGELRYRSLATGAEKSVRNGSAPTFSSNNRWLVYTIGVDSGGGRGRGARGGGRAGNAGGGGAGARNSVGIVDLRTGTATDLGDVQSYSLSKDGSHIALRRYPAAGRRSADLVVRNLDQQTDVTFGNVAEFGWSDSAPLLAMTIDVEGKTGNSVQLYDASAAAIRSLDAGDLAYTNLVWRPKSADLVAFRARSDSAFVDTSYTVIAWRGLSTPRAGKLTYDFASDAGFPKEMRVASYRRPQWSDDGEVLFFGIARRDPRTPPPPRGQQPARVQVWHWKDLRQYHQQEVQAAQDRQRTQLAGWHLGTNKFVRLADDSLEDVQVSRRGVTAIGTDERPYFKEVISGRAYRDLYRVDLATGKREKIATKVLSNANVSPSGRLVAYAQGGNWWVYDATSGSKRNLTAGVKTSFVDTEDDHPVPERRPYGLAGWATGDQAVLVYDRFDLWKVNVDGSNARRLTRGAEDSTVYRYVSLDDEGAAGGFGGGGRGGGRGGGAGGASNVDLTKPMILSATGEYSKKSGYSKLTPGQPVQRLLWVDKAIARLDKAKDADVYSFVAETYTESPNLFVGSAGLGDAKQISNTNAFLAEHAWGKQELMSYTNSRGDKLQMMLTYPADYQPGKQYPMVVYYYEKLSQGFHQFVVPTDRATYNTTVFSQNGYFVLRPDILFRARNPGYSGLDCVTAAVKTALARVKDIDPKRVGNMGHSWGGYQSAFYAVHNPGIFAATIAGAPLTNLISMYGYTSGNSGLPETGHFETGQERMQVPLWEDPQAYIRNSTVFAVDSLKTPLLLEEGSIDGNVNPFQSEELYNFGRRLGKQVVYLIYEDENHGVARPESQMDYHRRQLEWFNHFLKGEAAADWIVNGESYQARQKILNDARIEGGAPPAGGRGVRPTP
jgi:dipeptidyl aminopeptidase/acylaminoacyl peptidase